MLLMLIVMQSMVMDMIFRIGYYSKKTITLSVTSLLTQ